MKTEKERKIRKAQRVNLRCSLGFSSEDIRGDAQVTNISPAGCRAESDINVAEGLEFHVLVHLPGRSIPVKVERAIVRWVSGTAFGMSFILFLPSERAKLREYLQHLT